MSAPSTPADKVDWRELRALWPLLFFLAALLTWTKLEFGAVWSAVTTSAGALAAWAVVKFIKSSVEDGVKKDFLNALRSRRRARELWLALGAVVLASLVVGSVRVNADKLTRSVGIYRVQLESSAARAPGRSPHLLNAASAQRSFYVGLPFGKTVYLATSNNEMSRPMTVYPWIVPAISYPGDFSSLAELAVLPAPRVRLEFGGGRWLRLVIAREGDHPKLLAQDTLRSFQSRIVVFDTSTISDETARARWLPLAQETFSMDPSDAELLVTDWLHRRSMRSIDPLLPGQQLRVTLLNQKSDTVKTTVVTLNPGLSNAVLHE
jgi:hypothetical protein